MMPELKKMSFLISPFCGAVMGIVFSVIFNSSMVSVVVYSILVCTLGSGLHALLYRKSVELNKNVSVNKGNINFATSEKDNHVKKLFPFQLDSTFLFNTLHNISALCIVDPVRARHTIEKFSQYLRTLMNMDGKKFTILAEELKCAHYLLQIEKLRLGDRLEIEMDIDQDCLEFEIPCFILQPLVENAIQHGVEMCERKVKVVLAVYIKGENTIVEIRDEGKGITTAQIESVLNMDKSLAKLYEFLTSLYGSFFHMNIEALDPSGTRICLSLPRKRMYE